MDTYILYSTGCPLCLVATNVLMRKDIKFTTCTDIKIMEEKGYFYVPVLEIVHANGTMDVLSFKELMETYGLTENSTTDSR